VGSGILVPVAQAQVSLSQADSTGPFSLLITPRARPANSGMTWPSLTTRSFILMNMAARLTGSSSTCAALKVASYSALLQRTRLRLAHLLAFCAICSVVNCSMKICGSGCVMVVVYIWMSAQNFW
jgi:hypothetical protein